MRKLAVVLVALLAPATGGAQDFDFYAHGPYRPEVPRPATLLGYEPGEFHTNYGNMLRVIDAIASAASDRVRVFDYGRSLEGRPLRLVVVSAPENIARLDEIRAAIRRLRDPRNTRRGGAAEIARSVPAIGWMNYANDGNETAAFEAAIQVAYQLAAGEDTMTRAILENVVTVINPAHNPESHGRFVEWYNAFGVGDSSHSALEHDAPWGMSTNNNHYQIDLNRDALGITQRETRAIVAAHHEWSPQVFVDHHGQTTQFFMAPPVLPINPSLPKQQILRWTEVYGRANGAAFDRYGWNYFVRDVFDLHYPGYWDSWPALNGAIGMTYETDGGGSEGYSWARDDGTVVTFRDGIAKHFTASLATLRTTAEHREELLRDYHEFFRSGMNEFAAGRPWKRFVVVPGSDPERAARLVEILLRNDVEVRVATDAFRARTAHDYLTGRTTRREFPAGSYIIDLAQPQARLVDALLAPDAELDPEFLERQYEKRALNARRGAKAAKERYEFYDITGWSLPLSFGVDACWLEDAGQVAAQPLSVEFDELAAAWRPPALIGTRDVTRLPEALRAGIEGGVRGGRARTAYVFRYDRNASARLTIALMKEGYKVAVAAEPMRAGGTSYPRGTLVLRVNRNPDSLHERIDALARRFGVPVDAIHTGYYAEGPTGVGSNPVVTLRSPRVAVLAGDPVSTTSFGAHWYTLEQEFGLPFTVLRADRLTSQLPNYDVLVLPPGWVGGYRRAFGEGGAEALRDWVRDGGVLIAIAGAAEYLADPDLEFTSARLVGEEAEEGEEAAAELAPAAGAGYPPLVSPEAGERAPLSVPGAIIRASLDLTHPLTFGYESDLIAVLIAGADFYRPSKEGSNPVGFTGGDLLVAGFAWPDNTEKYLDGTAWMIDEPLGSGRVVLFADDPNFRLIWPSLSRLLLNAILIGPTVR
ncbi:MAG: hypothetical protein AMS25_03740 [Gemmatimonas sp. SM23_52]|nr:MAG: hypothetical protein AMS25_03740 [Gemmatimonas sp. SM23_52]